MADYTQAQFAAAVLDRLGIPQSRGALQALVGWEQAEGGHWKNSARYNPLNTTQNMPGSGDTGSQGNISVYKNWNQGVDATVQTLRNGRYGSILSALKAGNPNAVAKAIDSSPWGTHGSLVYQTITGAKAPSHVSLPGSSGNTPPAAAGPSGSGQPAAPTLTDPGQAGDFTGLLGQLLAKPEPVQQLMAVAPPSFSARAPLPQGFQAPTPEAVQAPQQQDGVSGALSLLETLRGTDPASASAGAGDAAGGTPETVVTSVMKQRAAAKQAGVSPNAKPGDPVVSSKQSVGGLHETAGLAGFPAHDYMAPAGSHAVAPVSGTVVKLSGHDPKNGPTNGPHGPFGYSLYIKGTDGKTYYLTHMGSRTVKAGQKVEQGQVIGTVGNYAKWGGADHIHQGVSG